MKGGSNSFMWYLRLILVVLLEQCIIKLYNFLKMSFHPVVIMMCNWSWNMYSISVFFSPCLNLFNFSYLWKVTNGKNKSKKSPNHIYSLLLILLEFISLVLLDLPCYHHETEVVLLNVNISIHTSMIDSILFQSFFVTQYLFFMRVL